MPALLGAALIAFTSLHSVAGTSHASRTTSPSEAAWCGQTKITAYVRTEYGPYTYDGTSILSDEPIVAASWDVKMGSLALIEGLGVFRVADRGMLGNGTPMPWVDVAVWSRAEAFRLTGVRHVCFRRPVI
jgi:hypothetical protein